LLIIAPTGFGLICWPSSGSSQFACHMCWPISCAHRKISSFRSYYFTSACLKSGPGNCLSKGWLCFPSVPQTKFR